MKAKAANWIKYNGEWHKPGEAFEIDNADAEEMKRIAEVIEDAPVAEPEEPAKRGRKRKEETV